MRSDLAADSDPLCFGERLDVPFRAAKSCPGTRRGDPAERYNGLVVNGLVVDVDHASRDVLGQLHGLHHVPREDTERQSILCVVCQGDSLVERRELHYWRYRAEDLVGICWHTRHNIGEDGGSIKKAFKAATSCKAS